MKGDQLDVWEGRHPATVHFKPLFAAGHLPEPMQTVSLYSGHLAEAMVCELPDGPELSAGLRKLVEAKDCFVRQAVITARTDEGTSTS